jgi:hypothetical protein
VISQDCVDDISIVLILGQTVNVFNDNFEAYMGSSMRPGQN